ncbi:MAG: CheR family methyltransferase, partial [Thermoguttaceae bacterium]
ETEIPKVAALVRELCGVVLDGSKGYLIDSRLGRLAETAGCANFSEFCNKARYSSDKTLQSQIVDAITTQETIFFRDGSPFEVLTHKVLPEVIDAKSSTAFPRRIRVWSAACSTGQEVYSIAMTFYECLPDISKWDIKILGTDISDAAVKQASLGRYANHEMQRGMKPNLLRKFFNEGVNEWRVKDELRYLAEFQRRNLLLPFIDVGVFDVIFCRNVAIYFDAQTKRDLFLRLTKQLAPNGYLFVGSSESLSDVGPQFTPLHHCRAVFYQPNKRINGNGQALKRDMLERSALCSKPKTL